MKSSIDLGRVKTVLVLEDNLERIKHFRNYLQNTTVTYTDQAAVAIDCVQKHKYDLIFLDHDLGGEIFVDSSHHNTGYQVAKAIPDSINAETPCIIHSLNSRGAENMKAHLPNAYRIPFYKLLEIMLG